MADLTTSLMGIPLSSPVIVGASTMSRKIDNIKRAQDSGAGAMVIHSLFQEQIEIETLELDEELAVGSETYAESLTYLPQMEHAGAREHIMWVEKTRKEVDMPIIGSLNATSLGNWVQYAHQLESAGCNALELNLYSLETDPLVGAEDIEKRSLDIISSVKELVKVPVSVKLSPFYTSIANFVAKAAEAGADSVVLFNRFYQPYIDPVQEKLDLRLDLSRSEDGRLPLRWIAILSDTIDTEFVANTGIHTGLDVVKQLLAGAMAVQSVSALYLHGLEYIADMNREIEGWMDTKGYASIDAYRGKLSRERVTGDPNAFERAQYIEALLQRK